MNRSSIAKVLQWSLAALGLLFIAIYLTLSLMRMHFPFQLEWIEGAILDQTIRVFYGQPVYIQPNIDFIPQIYPPLYFYLSAFMMHFTGIGFLPLRLVSWLASLGFLFLIFHWVRRETHRIEFGLLAASLMAACYKISGSWYDVARVDSLFVFFVLAAAYTIRFAGSPVGYLCAGVLVFLSWLTKQTATALFFPIFVYVLFLNRRQAAWIFGTALALALPTYLWLNHTNHGWYSYYVVNFAGYLATGYTKERFIHYWTKDLLGALPWVCLFVVIYLVFLNKAGKRSMRLFYVSFLAGSLVTSCVARIHWGGSENTLMPVYASLSILFGISASEFIDEWSTRGSFWMQQGVRAMCFVQLLSLFYTPQLRLPKKADFESGERLLEAMREVKGEVYAPRFGYLPRLAGKRTYAQRSMLDLTLFYDPVNGSRLFNEVEESIRQKRFDAILFESDIFRWTIEDHYVKSKPIEIQTTKFWSQDNARFVYIPRKEKTS